MYSAVALYLSVLMKAERVDFFRLAEHSDWFMISPYILSPQSPALTCCFALLAGHEYGPPTFWGKGDSNLRFFKFLFVPIQRARGKIVEYCGIAFDGAKCCC